MSAWFSALSCAAALGLATVAGFFLTFSDFLLRSLRLAPGEAGVEVMQIINREVFRSLTIVLMWSMLALGLGLTVAAVACDIPSNTLALVVTGASLYFFGVLGGRANCVRIRASTALRVDGTVAPMFRHPRRRPLVTRWIVSALVLVGCRRTAPPLTTTSEWAVGECGEITGVAVIRTKPGRVLSLRGVGEADRRGVADPSGVARFELTTESPDSFELTASGAGGPISDHHFYVDGRLLRQVVGRESIPSFATNCIKPGRHGQPTCALSVEHGDLTLNYFGEGTAELRHAGASATTAGAFSSVPVNPAVVESWDLSVLRAGGRCPHVTVPDVTVQVAHETYQGEVWLAEAGAQRVLAMLASRAIGSQGIGGAATGHAAIVVSRSSDINPVHNFVRFDGAVQRLADIAWVARLTSSTRRLGSCGTYRGRLGAQEVFRNAEDLRVEIVERATGRPVANTSIRGRDPGCASLTLTGGMYGDPNHAAANQWIAAQIARLNGGGAAEAAPVADPAPAETTASPAAQRAPAGTSRRSPAQAAPDSAAQQRALRRAQRDAVRAQFGQH